MYIFVVWLKLFSTFFQIIDRVKETKLEAIKQHIAFRNRVQIVYNIKKFGLTLGNRSTVMVVQVHNRTLYLRYMIDSLRNVDGIQKTLVIFSHDVYSDEINQIISNITFCPVLQIFFPHSQQLYPNR